MTTDIKPKIAQLVALPESSAGNRQIVALLSDGSVWEFMPGGHDGKSSGWEPMPLHGLPGENPRIETCEHGVAVGSEPCTKCEAF